LTGVVVRNSISVLRLPLRLVLVVAGLIGMAGPSHAGGVFDFLFQPRRQAFQQQPLRTYQVPIQFEPPPVVIRRQFKRRAKIAESGRGAPAVALCCKNGEDPLMALLADTTLRPGDAVATPAGIRIFQGRTRVDHNLGDFKLVANASSIPADKRALLKAMDANNHKADGGTIISRVLRTADVN
jgi:hypothetical protein